MLDPETKLRLLIHGVKTDLKPLRAGGAGPTGGLGFRINGSIVSAPAIQRFAKNSTFKLEKSGKNYILYENDKKIGKIELPKSEYYSESIDGIQAGKLVALDGYNALVSAVSRKCVYWDQNKKCMFCTIQNGIQNAVVRKNPDQLTMAVKLAYEEDKSRHLTLTTGTLKGEDKGAKVLIDAVRAIKKEVDIDLHVQIEPVGKIWIEKLYESGVDTVGIHAETFDESLRRKIVPGKPSLKDYRRAWSDAVGIFGEWNVSSWLIVGLGENRESVIEGFRGMTDMAVYPFIVPFRPHEGDAFQHIHSEHVFQILKDLSFTVKTEGIKIPEFKAGCPKCNGCSFVSEILR